MLEIYFFIFASCELLNFSQILFTKCDFNVVFAYEKNDYFNIASEFQDHNSMIWFLINTLWHNWDGKHNNFRQNESA